MKRAGQITHKKWRKYTKQGPLLSSGLWLAQDCELFAEVSFMFHSIPEARKSRLSYEQKELCKIPVSNSIDNFMRKCFRRLYS